MKLYEYDSEPCKQCGKKTSHLSGFCVTCRKTTCVRCAQRQVADCFKSVLCSQCKEKSKARNKNYNTEMNS